MSKQKVNYNEIGVAPLAANASQLYTASFFSGVRGIDIGAKRAGFSTLLHADWEKEAGRAFDLNINNIHEHLKSEGVYLSGKRKGDISKLHFSDMQEYISAHLDILIKEGRMDVIHGGPPCQDFSKNNNHRKINGQRNHLIFELLRIIEEAKPKVGLIEQVPDLLSPKFGHIWARIKLTLNTMKDYVWDYKIMNAKDHGARQSRKRLIIMLVRRDLGVNVSFPKETEMDLSKVAVKSLLPHVYSYSPGQYKDDIKDASKNIFCTMTATGSECFYGLDGRRRKPKMWERLVLTELEGLNLKGISQTHQKKLVGNMVQVSLAEALFRHIKKHILRV